MRIFLNNIIIIIIHKMLLSVNSDTLYTHTQESTTIDLHYKGSLKCITLVRIGMHSIVRL